MKSFIVYNQKGDILRTGICLDEDLSSQGELVMEGKANDQTQKIVDGKVINKNEN